MSNRVPGLIYASDVIDDIWRKHHPSQADALARRLDDGWARIERARNQGQDTTAWEDFWIDLLHQYEAEFDALPEAAK